MFLRAIVQKMGIRNYFIVKQGQTKIHIYSIILLGCTSKNSFHLWIFYLGYLEEPWKVRFFVQSNLSEKKPTFDDSDDWWVIVQ